MVQTLSLVGAAFAVGGSYFAVDSLRSVLIAKTINSPVATRLAMASAAVIGGLYLIGRSEGSAAGQRAKETAKEEIIANIEASSESFEAPLQRNPIDRFTRSKKSSRDSYRRKGRRSALRSILAAESCGHPMTNSNATFEHIVECGTCGNRVTYVDQTDGQPLDEDAVMTILGSDMFCVHCDRSLSADDVEVSTEVFCATCGQSFSAEDQDPNYMIRSDLHQIVESASRMDAINDEYPDSDYPPWFRSKLSVAAKDVDGLADNMGNIIANPDDFDAEAVPDWSFEEELAVGTREEMEHTDDREEAERIAREHLREDPDYYTKLAVVGLVKDKRKPGVPELWFAEYDVGCTGCGLNTDTSPCDGCGEPLGLCCASFQDNMTKMTCPSCTGFAIGDRQIERFKKSRSPFTDKDAESSKNTAGLIWSKNKLGSDILVLRDNLNTGYVGYLWQFKNAYGTDNLDEIRRIVKSKDELERVPRWNSTKIGAKTISKIKKRKTPLPVDFNWDSQFKDAEAPHYQGDCGDCKQPMMLSSGEIKDRYGVPASFTPAISCQECDEVVCVSCHPKVCPRCEESFDAESFDDIYCRKAEKTKRWDDGRYRCGSAKNHAGDCSAWSRSGSGKQHFKGYAPCEHMKAGKNDCDCILGDGVDDSLGARLGNHPLFRKKNAEAFSLSDRPVSVKFGPGTSGNAKMKAVFTDASGDTKTTQFGYKGMSDFTKHKDEGRKSSYLARHGSKGQNQNWNDPTTAGALSRWILWNKKSLSESKKSFKDKFDLRAEGIGLDSSIADQGYQQSPFITEAGRKSVWLYEPDYSITEEHL